jgi:hypothetical protein
MNTTAMKYPAVAILIVLVFVGCATRQDSPAQVTEDALVTSASGADVKEFTWGAGAIMVGMTKSEVLEQIKQTWKRPSDDAFAHQGITVPGVSEPSLSIQEGGRWELRYGDGSGAAPGGGGLTLVFQDEKVIQIVVLAICG